MLEISDKDKSLLRKISTDDTIDLLKSIANHLLVEWNNSPITKETDFLTIKEAISRDERKTALNLFFRTIDEICHDR